MTQEVITAVNRLLAAARSNNQGLNQTDVLKNKMHTIRKRILRHHPTGNASEDDELDIRIFEEELWSMYGLTGDIVPDELLKECQRRLRQAQPGSRSEMDRQEELGALDLIHRLRKAHSHAFSQLYAPGKWTKARRVPPDAKMRFKGIHFWALIIGNNDYPKAPLSGCINDAILVQGYLSRYLYVPGDHIRILRNASRETMVNAFYDLRDDERIKPDDNIVIHFSGHGSSYDTRDFFTTFASKVGSIEAICPVDRGDSIPDISEREINSILSELRAAKGPNITFILDCCHAGGAVRSFNRSDTDPIRFILPIRTGDALDLMRMFEAADSNPRRNPNIPNTSSELWMPDLSSFVLLAACHDFQYAAESNFKEEDTYRVDFNSEPRGKMVLPVTAGSSPYQDFQYAAESNSNSEEEDIYRADFDFQPRGKMSLAVAGDLVRPSPRQGRFTTALVKILESEMARGATYESVITSIGRLGDLQVPLAVGSRKHARLWFEK